MRQEVAETHRKSLNAERMYEQAKLAILEWEIVKSLGVDPHIYEIDYAASKKAADELM